MASVSGQAIVVHMPPLIDPISDYELCISGMQPIGEVMGEEGSGIGSSGGGGLCAIVAGVTLALAISPSSNSMPIMPIDQLNLTKLTVLCPIPSSFSNFILPSIPTVKDLFTFKQLPLVTDKHVLVSFGGHTTLLTEKNAQIL
ncbi:hypothetical protein ARMGADRAFT_1035699 [Armillaria gallica]|uniref:Uncharacterized protein n=1 Tax=Armillaria gallica TaxID=47427 RepID=A0A2H3DFK1_ARMGA|nr:hypothetical protein ARMGADRAFT_1035699 [Armillaria gallica]